MSVASSLALEGALKYGRRPALAIVAAAGILTNRRGKRFINRLRQRRDPKRYITEWHSAVKRCRSTFNVYGRSCIIEAEMLLEIGRRA